MTGAPSATDDPDARPRPQEPALRVLERRDGLVELPQFLVREAQVRQKHAERERAVRRADDGRRAVDPVGAGEAALRIPVDA